MEHWILQDPVARDLNIKINLHFDIGWSLQGQIFFAEETYHQCMMREDNNTTTISTWRYNELQDKEETLARMREVGVVTLDQTVYDSLISDQETLALIRKEG